MTTIEDIYAFITLYTAPGLLIGLALCFFFLTIPNRAGLRNYRTARCIMGYTYLVYAVGLLLAHYCSPGEEGTPFSLFISISISCSQALLFTYTLITLIHVDFVTRHRLTKEALPILSFIIVLSVMNVAAPEAWFRMGVYLYVLYYISLLVKYTLVFRVQYKGYVARMDNFFSDEEYHRLRWVSDAFYASLTIGIAALVYGLLASLFVAVLFMCVAVSFYAGFGIRFINYAFKFPRIETAITETTSEEECVLAADTSISMPEVAEIQLMERIEMLIETEQLYRQPDLSIEQVAALLEEKTRAISTAINRCHGQNFKSCINEYRVREAVRLLTEDEQNLRTIDAIAADAGFTDRSNFYRVFKKHKGVSPSDFKKNI